MSGRIWVLLLAGVAFGSAVEIVLQRHETRKLFSEIYSFERQQNELELEWGQLLLEQGTWGTHSRIEEIATDRLHMQVPRDPIVRREES